jgi:hypothetical protein
MKKITFLLSITFLLLQSCSSSDGSSSSGSQSLVGKWEVSKLKTFPASTIITGNESLPNYNHPCATKKDYIEFWSEGTAKFVYHNQNCSQQSTIANWVKTDFILNLSSNGDSIAWEIISLTSSELKIKYPNPPTGTPMEYIVISYNKAN